MLLSGVAIAAPGLTKPEAVGPFLDGAFPSSSPGTSPDGAFVQEDYYPGLTFIEPLRIIQHPVEDRLVVVGKDGKGWTVKHAPGATDKKPFFDISSIMQGKSDIGEGGISDLVFHPEFGQNGSPNAAYVYISYRFAPGKGGTFDSNPTVDGYNRVSRFSVVNGQVDLSTELVLISQFDREQWHIGMDMEFGKDGFLYISVGDEGNCCDRLLSTQRLDGGLWSGILRIDVNQDPMRSHAIRRQPTNLAKDPALNGPAWPASHTQGYFIPNDNPFVDKNGGNLEEFYSIGLRHPWTISFDKATGNLWAADVGQSDREEIDLVQKGDNHQWGFLEGTLAGPIPRPAKIIGKEVPPVWEYDHAIGKAVIGAGVYRGDQFPELVGKYLFSDFITGLLWTATPQPNAAYKVDKIGEVTSDFPNGINSYLLDTKGNIMLARSKGALQPGSIERLVHKADAVAAKEPPALLSQTGAFADLATLKPRAGCIPYELIVPFWSDGAKKSRWMCVPNDGSHDTAAEQVTITPEGDWQFPVGSVMIKHFNLLMNESDPQSGVRVETRFLVQGVDRHYGVTYRWKPDGSDAELLKSGADIDYDIQSPAGPRKQTWHIPGRNQCQTCHGAATISVLGPKSRQLNRDEFYPSSGLMGNQLETLNALGIVKVDAANLATLLTSTRTNDCTAPIEARARSYIDSNCAYCHRPNGVRANFDARLTTPLADSKIVGGGLADSLGIVGEAVVVPGGLDQSVAYLRANSVKEGFLMPPLAKAIVDQPGMSVVNSWIGFLKSGDPNAGKELCLKDPEGAATGGSGGSGVSGVSGGQLTAGSGGVGSPQGGNGALGGGRTVAGPDSGCGCVLAPLSQRSPWASLLPGLAAAAAVALRRRRASVRQ